MAKKTDTEKVQKKILKEEKKQIEKHKGEFKDALRAEDSIAVHCNNIKQQLRVTRISYGKVLRLNSGKPEEYTEAVKEFKAEAAMLVKLSKELEAQAKATK